MSTGTMHDRNWNFDRPEDLLYAYMGETYANTPEDIERIAFEKATYEAPVIADMLALDAADRVLDLGSGYGHIARVLAPRVAHYTCADISREMLARCRQATGGLPNIEHLTIERGNLQALAGRQLTKVLSNSVFIHLNLFDISIYIDQVAALLPPGGRFYFNFQDAELLALEPDPNFAAMRMRYLRDPDEITLMHWNSMTAIRALAKRAGFEERRTQHWRYCATLVSYERV
jgi:SAM-dependent methyltransferase